MYCFSFEKGIIKLDTVVPCSCETHKQPQVSCFFFDWPLVYGLTKEEWNFLAVSEAAREIAESCISSPL